MKSMPHETSRTTFIPRPHQLAARDAILAARHERRPGFLLGDLTGLGKTLSVWAALAVMPEDEILIACPKGGMPQWRRTIALSGLPPKKVTLINYERTKSLFTPPPASTRRSARAKNNELARHGQPKRTWPVVVFDESHRLRNPYAQQSMACPHERYSRTVPTRAVLPRTPARTGREVSDRYAFRLSAVDENAWHRPGEGTLDELELGAERA